MSTGKLNGQAIHTQIICEDTLSQIFLEFRFIYFLGIILNSYLEVFIGQIDIAISQHYLNSSDICLLNSHS